MTSISIGWIGALLLAFCGLPELIKTIKTKQCNLSWPFLLMWGFGEFFTLIPIVDKNLGTFLLMNYSVNLVIILILSYFKAKGRGDDDATFIY